MNKIYMYAHGGSGNHGCEAIVRSTLKILNDVNVKKELFSTKPEEDQKYGIGNLCNVMSEKALIQKKYRICKSILGVKSEERLYADG